MTSILSAVLNHSLRCRLNCIVVLSCSCTILRLGKNFSLAKMTKIRNHTSMCIYPVIIIGILSGPLH